MSDTNKEPWSTPGVPWKTESAFLSWVRGVLRKGWSRHPVKMEFIKTHRERIPNPNPAGRNEECWGMTCAICDGKFALSIPKKTRDRVKKDFGIDLVTIEIDHKTQAGSLKCAEDIGGFATRLFYVTFDDLQPLCQTCHQIITLAQKHGLTFEQARAEKEVIKILKLPAAKQKQWLEEQGVSPARSPKERSEQIREVLRESK